MKISRVAVIGAGNMGASIAEVMAFNGFEVALKDTSMDLVGRGMQRIRSVVNSQVRFQAARGGKEIERIEKLGITLSQEQKGKIMSSIKPDFTREEGDALLSRIHPTESYDDLRDADLVIEAVFESHDVKKKLFEELSGVLNKRCILASNTSSLGITSLSRYFSDPSRVFVTHFFNPPFTLRLIEVVPSVLSNGETLNELIEFLGSLMNHRGPMVPIRVKEMPGFVVNRILVPMMNEAAAILDEGGASAKDIDLAMKLGAGMPMGPLELSDMVGLDVVQYVMEVLYSEYASSKYAPSLLVKKLVSSGRLGRKTGSGFFDY
ncbi:MAG: 3-hydroxyacyl-CoA dehydrogenase family protein [Candidatus Thermoplasmatota archaeon]|nr:3-hydroxyacyl-CoA dehydrogenase family protein [Candidatus Thermoplasmatota archaeon]